MYYFIIFLLLFLHLIQLATGDKNNFFPNPSPSLNRCQSSIFVSIFENSNPIYFVFLIADLAHITTFSSLFFILFFPISHFDL